MKIPLSTVPRISLYYRALLSIHKTAVVSSTELADLTGGNAAQVRKDLAYFGQFGRPGYGYQADSLREKLGDILGKSKIWDVALIGVGNLGSALLAYRGFKSQGFNIKYAFDTDKNKINNIKRGIKIKDIKALGQEIKRHEIDIAIIAIPQEEAQKVIDILVKGNVKAILNFAPIHPKVPKGVEVLNIDLSIQLDKLAYFLKHIDFS